MSYVLFSFSLIIIALVLLYLRNHYTYWTRRGLPQEDPLYGLGNMKGIGRTVHFRDVNQRLYEHFKRSSNAPFGGMYMFFSRTGIITDLDLIRQILIKDFASFHDRGLYSNVRDDPLTGHLVALEGKQWEAMRHKLSPVFTSLKMKFMFPTIVKVAENLSQTCGELMQADKLGELEIKELSARYTTDVIGTCAFGIQCNSLADPKAEFRERGRSIFGKPRHSQLVQAFIITNPTLARNLRMKLFADEVSDFFIGAVLRTVAYRLEHNVKRNDFMDLLIELLPKDQGADAQSDDIDLSQGLTLLQLAAQAFVFFLAGFDTSSTTMSFCLYELGINEYIQNKLRAEINEVLERHNNEISYEAMSEMKYLDQVLAETIRKYPVLPHLLRKSNSEYHVPNTTYTIERNTNVIIPVHAIHHDPELYPEPEKFDPNRFTPEAKASRHPCAYLAFGDGPRHCIGKRFGQMQAKVGLIQLLKDYKFSRSARTEVPVLLSKENFIISAENGIYLHVERVKA